MLVHNEPTDEQYVFRGLLAALSRPAQSGAIERRGGAGSNPLVSVLKTLLDHEVSCAVLGVPTLEIEREGLHATGVRRVTPEEADFVLVLGQDSHGRVQRAKRGTLAYPEESATLIYFVDAFDESLTPAIRLTGPGIEYQVLLSNSPVSHAEWRIIAACNAQFPLGVDTLFVSKRWEIMGLPRSTSIEVS